MVIVYKLSALTYGLGRLLVNIDFIGLPNIIANQGIVKELIQHEASAENMAREVLAIVNDQHYRRGICKQLLAVKQQLGQGGGSVNMAKLALEMLAS
jgi:lipid-A-disaccharide synthase